MQKIFNKYEIMCLNTKIDILDIFTLTISLFALIATLRKKEFGVFYFMEKPEDDLKNDLWIKLIKSDIYNVKFVCEPYTNMKCRIDLYSPEDSKTSVLKFTEETKPIMNTAIIKENSIVKFINCQSSKIHIEFKDRYNNHYTQELTQNRIAKRKHTNILNLTFFGT